MPVLPPLTRPYITRHSVTTAAHFYCFPGGLWCTAQSAITKISIRAFSPALGRADSDNYSIYAMAMGYNVITSDVNGYHNIIDRKALVYRASDN